MESTPGQPLGPEPARRGRDGWLLTAGTYIVLLVLGGLQSLIGSFQYSRGPGSFPVVAAAFAAGIGVTCILAAWGMRRPLGGLMPGVGWFLTSFVLAMSTPGGSVVITNTTAGKWYLFGGSICVAAGVVIAFALWSPARPPRGRPAAGSRAWKPDS